MDWELKSQESRPVAPMMSPAAPGKRDPPAQIIFPFLKSGSSRADTFPYSVPKVCRISTTTTTKSFRAFTALQGKESTSPRVSASPCPCSLFPPDCRSQRFGSAPGPTRLVSLAPRPELQYSRRDDISRLLVAISSRPHQTGGLQPPAVCDFASPRRWRC